jgi:small subunit ribosomal protein S4
MGDPKKRRKKYSMPMQRWNSDRIEEERELMKQYALSNKQEIRRMDAIARKFKGQARELITKTTEQAQKERKAIIARAHKLGLATANAELDEILGITLRNIIDRRLQTVVWKRGLAASPSQSRQFITHRHIMVGEKKVTMPSYLVSIGEEASVRFADNSSLHDAEHPERAILAKMKEKPKKEKVDRRPPMDRRGRPGDRRQGGRGGRQMGQRRQGSYNRGPKGGK